GVVAPTGNRQFWVFAAIEEIVAANPGILEQVPLFDPASFAPYVFSLRTPERRPYTGLQAARDLGQPKTGYASLRITGTDAGETTVELPPIPVSSLKEGQQLQGSFQFNGSGEIRARLLVELLDEAGNPLSRRLVERGFMTKPNLWQATGFKAVYQLQPEEKALVRSIGIKFAGAIPATGTLWLDNVVVR
ncbi:MAG TPA: hypothetical protein PLY73_05285, partial [Candidatus Ozemobacteraceae bacterium]|nr:hypothetical protein [Candidatus Ozemobacteraceae bacterium]